MNRRNDRRPSFDPLEGRQLLSTAHFDHIVARPAAVITPVALEGTLVGGTSSVKSSTKGPESLRVRFNGQVAPLGSVQAVYTERLEFNYGQVDSATVALRGPHGSLTLASVPGNLILSTYSPTGNSTEFAARVVSATGVYAHASGSEDVTVTEQAGNIPAYLSVKPTAS
jgi:hypothetical protein